MIDSGRHHGFVFQPDLPAQDRHQLFYLQLVGCGPWWLPGALAGMAGLTAEPQPGNVVRQAWFLCVIQGGILIC